MTCKNCGSVIPENSEQCLGCGAIIVRNQTRTVSPPPNKPRSFLPVIIIALFLIFGAVVYAVITNSSPGGRIIADNPNPTPTHDGSSSDSSSGKVNEALNNLNKPQKKEVSVERIESFTQRMPAGEYGIYMLNLKNQDAFSYRGESVYPSSAMSYITIMSAVLGYLEEHNMNPDSEYLQFSYLPGNGREIPNSSADADRYISIKRIIEGISSYGDNNRANNLVNYVGNNNQANGFSYINSYLRKNGYTHTEVNRKIFTGANSKFIDENANPNVTTAKEICNLFYNFINNGILGNSSYMKRICSYKSTDNRPVGVTEYLGHVYDIANHNASNSSVTNEVLYVTVGDTELVIAVLSEYSINDIPFSERMVIIASIVEYLIESQLD